jgi:pyruvate dehydrogenase E1 component beta subunit
MSARTEAVVGSGATTPPALTIREAIIAGITEELHRDDRVLMIGQDIGAFGGPLHCTAGLLDAFGAERLIETPICESSMVSLALGAAQMGLRPIVDVMFADMLPLAAVPLVQIAGAWRWVTVGRSALPVVIRTRGGDGPYRSHPQNYEAMFAHAPGLVIVQPSTPGDAKGLIKAAIRSDDPVIFMENIFLYNAFRAAVPDDPDTIVPLGRASVVRGGTDVTLVTYGRAVRTSLQAAAALEREGVEVEIVDLRTLSPWDEDTVAGSVAKSGRLLVVHEAWECGGIGAEIVARIGRRSWGDLQAPPARLGAPAVPIPWAPPLRDAMLPTADRVLAAVRSVLQA